MPTRFVSKWGIVWVSKGLCASQAFLLAGMLQSDALAQRDVHVWGFVPEVPPSSRIYYVRRASFDRPFLRCVKIVQYFIR